jgi:micrococcal nuclease
MDTPERGDYFFEEATQANAQLVEGQTVTMVQDISQTDRYGRLLRYVYLADGTFVNAELVRLGYAVIATYPPDVKYQAMFLELQTSAREQGVGLWATATSQPADLFTPPPPAGEIPAQCTCVAFGTHASAQACYDHCWATVNKDVYRLDRDQDRQACESLP